MRVCGSRGEGSRLGSAGAEIRLMSAYSERGGGQ